MASIGSNTQESLKTKMQNICTDYKAIWLWWKYAPELLPKGIKTFKDLQDRYQKFPNVTEQEAELWLYEKPVQDSLKELLKSQHTKKMMELYNIYFEKAKTDVHVYYDENVPLFRRNGYRKSGTMILRVRSRDTALN